MHVPMCLGPLGLIRCDGHPRGAVRLPACAGGAGTGGRRPGGAHGGVLQRCAGLPAGVVPAAPRAGSQGLRSREPGDAAMPCRVTSWRPCMSPGCRGGSVIVDPGSRVCLQERAGRPPGSPALLLVAEDRGGVLGADTVPVVMHVDLRRPLDRPLRPWERRRPGARLRCRGCGRAGATPAMGSARRHR